MANITWVLSALEPESVAYDIIFAREISPDADQAFMHSISQLGSVFLPFGFAYSSEKSRLNGKVENRFVPAFTLNVA